MGQIKLRGKSIQHLLSRENIFMQTGFERTKRVSEKERKTYGQVIYGHLLTQHSRNCLASMGEVKFKPQVSLVIGSFQ